MDDDQDILGLLEEVLRRDGLLNIRKAITGWEAVSLCRDFAPDVIILDVLLPDIDGFEVCQQIRRFSQAPILFLSSKSDEVDKILGLATGGDDYVTKPFSPREMLYRVKAQLRRQAYAHSPRDGKAQVILAGPLRIDVDASRAFKGRHELSLTAREYGLLLFLAENANRILSKERLCERVWGDVARQLNQLDADIRASDELRDATNRQREQWIANITHDLKTPLSPIKGYAEILADPASQPGGDEVVAYARIMQKNVGHMEQLIDDMKLLYQMEGGIFRLRLEHVDVTRQLKELVIDLLNTPAHTGATILFEGSGLGLAIAQEIAALHSGVVSVRSRVGEGTIVEIQLRKK